MARLSITRLQSRPNRPALSYVDGGQSYTYKELRLKSLELSHIFSRYGIDAGDRIAILSQNMPNWTVALFSIVPFGRVAVPILPDSSESEVTNILTHSETKDPFHLTEDDAETLGRSEEQTHIGH